MKMDKKQLRQVLVEESEIYRCQFCGKVLQDSDNKDAMSCKECE